SELTAALDHGVFCLVMESLSEIELLAELMQTRSDSVKISLRINPEVEVPTHPYISTGLRQHKFGLDIASLEQALEIVEKNPQMELTGIGSHIGSQILAVGPFEESLRKLLEMARMIRAAGFPLRHLDLGGGFGIPYQEGTEFDLARFAESLERESTSFRILMEPGRFIVGRSGALVSTVLHHKVNHDKQFMVIDAAMNDLIRPTLYQAYHRILPVIEEHAPSVQLDVVGPICETSDFLAKDRALPLVEPGRFLAIMDAGAYGFVAASNYNSRPRAAEVLVDGQEFRLIRKRETYEDLIRGEST
ncbi:MAG: diaminopimelate decarboxylase, partial [Acidobacteriota bacterium]